MDDRFDDEPFDPAAVEAGAWWPGPYGAGDTLGTYQEVTPERTARALAMLAGRTSVRTFHLDECLYVGYPAFGSRRHDQHLVVSGTDPGAGFAGEVVRDHPWGPNRLTHLEERVATSFNLGAKINGLHHCGVGQAFYAGRRLDDLIADHGSTDLDTPTWGPPLVTRGLLVDVLGLKLAVGDEPALSTGPDGAPLLRDDYRITCADLRDAVERQDLPAFEPGDAICIRTGWRRLIRTDPARYLRANPGVYLAETRWLASFRPALVAADTWGWETIAPEVTGGQRTPCHQELFVRFGIRLGEGLAFDELAEAGVDRFVFCHAPLRVEGAVSSNAPPFALA